MSAWRKGLGDAEFEALHAAYEASLPAKLRQIDTLARQLREAGSHGMKDTASDLGRAAHRLAGSAGNFGFAKLSNVASELEDLTTEILHRDDPSRDAQLETLEDLLARMHEVASQR